MKWTEDDFESISDLGKTVPLEYKGEVLNFMVTEIKYKFVGKINLVDKNVVTLVYLTCKTEDDKFIIEEFVLEDLLLVLNADVKTNCLADKISSELYNNMSKAFNISEIKQGATFAETMCLIIEREQKAKVKHWIYDDAERDDVIVDAFIRNRGKLPKNLNRFYIAHILNKYTPPISTSPLYKFIQDMAG